MMTVILCFTLVGCQGKTSSTDSTQTQNAAQTETTEQQEADEDTTKTTDETTDGSTTEAVTMKATEVVSIQGEYSDNAMDSSWADSEAVNITLDGTTIQAEGSGVTVEDNVATITKGGTYVLSGTLTDGQIVVDTKEDKNVQLVLNDANITNTKNAAILIKNTKNMYLTVEDGTENSIADGAAYEATSEEEEATAAIYSKTELIINGTGTLTVTGNYKDAITSKDDLQIISGNLTIQAEDDGIVGKDSVNILDGEITIQAKGDGIKSTNTEDSTKGMVIIDGGNLELTTGADGIQAETQVIINAGNLNIITEGEIIDHSSNDNRMMGGKMNGDTAMGGTDTTKDSTVTVTGGTQTATTEETTESSSTSAKALKATNAIGVFGGTIVMNSTDDAIHSNSAVRIDAGEIQITSGDDGIHSDYDMLLAGGTITINKSYEGLESQNITINDGVISVIASDDGVNISGGNDGSSVNGRAGQNQFSETTAGMLTITGGTLAVNAQGDGLDSNGSMEISGGVITVDGPTGDGNGALDYNGTCEITGGELYLAGSAGMAQVPSEDSTQTTVATAFSSTIEGGTKVTVTDADGKVVYEYTPTKTFAMVAISAPDLVKGESYTITAGSQSVTVTAGDNSSMGTGGMIGGGMGGGKGNRGNRP